MTVETVESFAQYDRRERDRERLHRHRNAARHRNGYLRHDCNYRRKKSCIAGFLDGKCRFRRGFRFWLIHVEPSRSSFYLKLLNHIPALLSTYILFSVYIRR